MINVAYWSQPDVTDGKLIYVLAYKDLAARDAAWAAFRADPEWQAAAALRGRRQAYRQGRVRLPDDDRLLPALRLGQ